MNCKSVQELLPLYVSRDLDEKCTHQVRAHLQSCAECGASASEYHETRQMLQEFAPPSFSEGFYSGIRQSVWREIQQEIPDTKTAPLTRLFDGLFRPRLGWALVSALLLAVGLSAFYFIAQRGNDNRQVSDRPSELAPRKGPSSSTSNQGSKGSDTAIVSGEPKQRPYIRKRLARSADRLHTLAVSNRPQRSLGNEAALESNKLAEPNTVESSEKVFRLEMQTRDPNIRIIWLTPQRTKRDLPGKVSKSV
jgi:hypothetical protein